MPTAYTAQAEALLQEEPDRAAPVLWRSEFRNVLAGYLRRKTMGFEDAKAVQAEAESLLAGNEYDVNSDRVLDLVRDSDCSAYDCEFVALAIQLDVMLVTGCQAAEGVSFAGRRASGRTTWR